MSAPLYSRFKRHFDRDTAVFSEESLLIPELRRFRLSTTRVYSMSDDASFETGAFSASEPADLLRACDALYMPTERLWIEFNWQAFAKGVNTSGLGVIAGLESPVRMGLLVSGEHKGDQPKTYLALIYYLYPNGVTTMAPIILAIYQDDLHPKKWNWDARMTTYATLGLDGPNIAIGLAYGNRYPKNPKLVKALGERLDFYVIAPKKGRKITKNDTLSLIKETHGSTRVFLAALAACLSARAPSYARDPNAPQAARSEAPVTTAEPGGYHEVNLFLKSDPRPGKSILASLKMVERKKKGLHDVGAHWAYRNNGSTDPTVCTTGQRHDFEPVPDTHSEVCIVCGQKRWFKAEHKRGDAAYGIVPPKVYNVRKSHAQSPHF